MRYNTIDEGAFLTRLEMPMNQGDDFYAKTTDTNEPVSGTVSPGTRGFAVRWSKPLRGQSQTAYEYKSTDVFYDEEGDFWFIDGFGLTHPDY